MNSPMPRYLAHGKKIFVFGAPGAGKTIFSRYLKLRLNVPLVEADYLRECLAILDKTEQEAPFLYVGVKEAYRKLAHWEFPWSPLDVGVYSLADGKYRLVREAIVCLKKFSKRC
jgi:predicted kinase